jgi:UDP-N-acetylglucosamine 2-epimerase (non-hydrolysing)
VKRVLVAFGTRPEAIKVAPLVLALTESPLFEPVVVVTAQHREMLDQVLRLFGIVPAHDLDILQERQSLTDVTVRALDRLAPVLSEERPDAVVVQGDTTTTLAGALSAYYHRTPVVHLEAGLRTNDIYSPYPEEMNRRLTSQLAALHLAPTPVSRDNLLAEGIPRERVVVTGNTVIDALHWTVARSTTYGDPGLADLDRDPRRVLLVTAHRRESWGEPMTAIGQALGDLARRYPDLLVVFPIHRNPVVREAILPAVDGLPNVRMVEPVDYDGFARLMDRAHVVLTDSGGVQEEAPSLGKPVLVMRENTERPEAVSYGTARLVGTDRNVIVGAVSELLDDDAAYGQMANAVNPYGDGAASQRCVAALAHFLGSGPPATEFDPGKETLTQES